MDKILKSQVDVQSTTFQLSDNINTNSSVNNYDESFDLKFNLKLANLEKNLIDLNEKLLYSKFNLEKLHCDLLLSMSPEFLMKLESVEIKCDKCLTKK